MAVSNIGVVLGNIVFRGMNHFTSIPMETQEKTLAKIMKTNKDCELGKKYDLSFDCKNCEMSVLSCNT